MRGFCLIVLHVLPITLLFFLVVGYVVSFGIPFFVAAAVNVVFVLRLRPVRIGNCFVLTGAIVSAVFHNKTFVEVAEKSYQSTR
jgi:hypothetical protein